MYERVAFKKILKIGAAGFILLFLFFGANTPFTYSRYFDEEGTSSNTFRSVVLDLGLRTTESSSIYSHTVEIGGTEEFNIFVQSLGSAAFTYSQEIDNETGENLCPELNLKVWYYWYDLGGGSHNDLKYDGALKDFELNIDGSDGDLNLPNSNDYYPNSDYSQNEHWFHYQIELPDDYSGELDESCEFDMRFKGWSEGFAPNGGFWDVESIFNTVEIEDTIENELNNNTLESTQSVVI